MGNEVVTGGGGFAFAIALEGVFKRRWGDAVFFMSEVHAACGFGFMPGEELSGEDYKPEGAGSTPTVCGVGQHPMSRSRFAAHDRGTTGTAVLGFPPLNNC